MLLNTATRYYLSSILTICDVCNYVLLMSIYYPILNEGPRSILLLYGSVTFICNRVLFALMSIKTKQNKTKCKLIVDVPILRANTFS